MQLLCHDLWKRPIRAIIFKRLWSPGIDSKESIPPAYVAWRAGTTTLFLVPIRFLAPIDCLTLIPPSGGLYGSQILLFKVLEVQMCY